MPRWRIRRFGPSLDLLDARVALSGIAYTPADLAAYAKAYELKAGQPGFTPEYDFQNNGVITKQDAEPILRSLASVTPFSEARVQLALAMGEQVTGHHTTNSGGVTHDPSVTIVGKTTPNSIIFTDGSTAPGIVPSTGNFQFTGMALTSNDQGYFEYPLTLPKPSRGGALVAIDFLIRTPFGQQVVRAFPIRLVPPVKI
jgi:hypothetical protein